MNSYCHFGATGGCTNACLVHTLNAGFHATALARTPSKLYDMLHAQGITQDVIDAQLTIFKGNIADIHAIKDTLSNRDAGTTGTVTLASQIISDAGGIPQMQMSLRRPALQEIYKAQPSTALHKPSTTVISTTGVSNVKEDVPVAFRILYHVFLADPHKDKKEMERLVTENTGNGGAFRCSVIVRPSLLMGDQSVKGGQGWEKLKVGREDEPAVGYTVHRADVGQWIFEQVVKTGGEARFGPRITLTN
ncbi:hypothetical protein F5H01DRAFT_344116 [Linnemannia elongata]|nr:hypothetical protein F5H01DRAFT_344116 [Linnemannia elongata]